LIRNETRTDDLAGCLFVLGMSALPATAVKSTTEDFESK
jgi:hypothetical protein